MRPAAILAVGATLLAAASARAQTAGPAASYWVYVANESSDLVSRVRFGPEGLLEEKTIPVGIMPADLDGAHGLSVSPDGRYWYLSLAHGTPFGYVWQFETGTDRHVGTVEAGLFPATMGLTPDGSLLLVSNFNLHGNHVPSSVSAIFTPRMQEMARIETCVMPHGGRVNHAGTRHYSACMMDDLLVEISTERLAVRRKVDLAGGHAHGTATGAAESHAPVCKPTWVAVAPDDAHVYVPCNGAGQVLELETEGLTVTRRFATGKGPYNADVTPDGRLLVVTLKGDQAVALVDLASGKETRVATSRPVTHGVAVTPDSRYAFVSNEAVGATRGTVDVIDLRAARLVASVPVQFQPGGIGFWKMERRPPDS